MSKKKDKKSNDKGGNSEYSVKIALIGAVATVVVAILGFPPLIAILSPTPVVATTTSVEPSHTPIVLVTAGISTPIPTSTLAATDVPQPTETFTPFPAVETVTVTLPPTLGLPIGMQVKITANQTRGKSPLTIKLDARDSFLRAPDGAIFECSKGACSYIWYVYLNNVEFTKPQETRGTIEFRFDKKGTYFISVYICHGSDNPTCGNSGTAVIVE